MCLISIGFSLVDKMVNKYVSSFLCFSYMSGTLSTNTMCIVVATMASYVNTKIKATLDYMPSNEKVERIHLLCANDS